MPVLICSARALGAPTGLNTPVRPPLGPPPALFWGPAPSFQPILGPPVPASAVSWVCVSPVLPLALSTLAPDWIPQLDPGPGALLAVPRAVDGPCCQPRLCPTCSAPAGWHPTGEGTACAGVALPQLLP